MFKTRGARNPCGTPFLRRRKLLRLSLPVVSVDRVAILANLSPDFGNLANFESVWLQIFWFGDFLKAFDSKFLVGEM